MAYRPLNDVATPAAWGSLSFWAHHEFLGMTPNHRIPAGVNPPWNAV